MAYLELFIRSITSERILEIFLRVLVIEAYDNKPLIDLLICHINSESIQVCVQPNHFRTFFQNILFQIKVVKSLIIFVFNFDQICFDNIENLFGKSIIDKPFIFVWAGSSFPEWFLMAGGYHLPPICNTQFIIFLV